MSFSMMSVLLALTVSPASAGAVHIHGGQVSLHVTFDPWSPSYRPAHRPGYTWVSGYYDRHGHWVPGHWMPTAVRAGYYWVSGYWSGAHYTDGYWRRGSHPTYIRSSVHVDRSPSHDHDRPSGNIDGNRASGGRPSDSDQSRDGRSDDGRPDADTQRSGRGDGPSKGSGSGGNQSGSGGSQGGSGGNQSGSGGNQGGNGSNQGGSGGQRDGGGSQGGGGKSRGR